MKKVLLSILTLCVGLTVQAQVIENGYYPERGYAMDFVNDVQNVQNVYWWEQSKDTIAVVRVDSLTDLLAAKPCTTFRAPYVYSWERVPSNSALSHAGYVSYKFNQAYGNYEPVGVGFGVGKTLDVSHENAILGFKFKNTSAITIVVQVGLQDVNKNIINSMALSTPTGPKKVASTGQSYLEQVSFTIISGASVDTVLNFNASRLPSYTPYYPLYAKDDCNRSLAPTTTNPNPTQLRNFDYSKLYAVTFTVVNAKVGYPAGEDGYKPNSLKGATFQISMFRVGTPYALGLKDDDQASSPNVLSIYPNPVNNGILNLSSVAQNIKVLDVLGNVVITSSSAKELNVSSLNKGVYTLQCSKGTSRFVVE